MSGLFDGPSGTSMNRVLAFWGVVLGYLLALSGAAFLGIVLLRVDLTTGAVEALGLATLGAGLVGGSEYLKNKGKQLENGQ